MKHSDIHVRPISDSFRKNGSWQAFVSDLGSDGDYKGGHFVNATVAPVALEKLLERMQRCEKENEHVEDQA